METAILTLALIAYSWWVQFRGVWRRNTCVALGITRASQVDLLGHAPWPKPRREFELERVVEI